MTRKAVLKLMVVLIVLGAVSAVYFHWRTKSAAQQEGMPPTAVKIAVARIQNWQPQIQAAGTLNAQQGIMLKAETAGRITKIDVQSGQAVKAGQILFEINPAVLKAQLAALEAKSDLTKGDYERAVKLYKFKDLSKQDLDTAAANKNADLANLEAVRAQLAQNIIRAPISGKLGLRLFNLGDYIKPEQPLINLQSAGDLRVDFSIPANRALGLMPGDQVLVRSDIYPGKQFSGKVTAVDSAVDINTRTIAVRADIPNPEGKLMPGDFVQVTLYAGRAVPYVTVPQIAIVYGAQDNEIYIIQKGHAVKKQVYIIQQNNSQAALRDGGIKAGEQVITEGQLKIEQGSPVYAIH